MFRPLNAVFEGFDTLKNEIVEKCWCKEKNDVEKVLEETVLEVRQSLTPPEPTGDKPADEKPTSDKPVGDKPAGEKPEGEKPKGDRPTKPNEFGGDGKNMTKFDWIGDHDMEKEFGKKICKCIKTSFY